LSFVPNFQAIAFQLDHCGKYSGRLAGVSGEIESKKAVMGTGLQK